MPLMSRPAELVLTVLVVTALVTAASYLAPAAYATTVVAAVFLGATHVLVLRKDAATIRAHGLSLGGLLEPERIDPARLARAALRAVLVAAIAFAAVALPFWYAYREYNHLTRPFSFRAALPDLEEALGQVFVIALPEEAFYRGFVQTRMDELLPRRVSILGLPIGTSIVVTSAVFALCHLLTIPSPARLAVFFPSLLFGALRAREGGVGAAVLFHASCNLLSAALARGYSP